MQTRLPVLASRACASRTKTSLPLQPDRRIFLLLGGVAVAVGACTLEGPKGDAEADAPTPGDSQPPNDAGTDAPVVVETDTPAPPDVPPVCMTRPADVAEGGVVLLSTAAHGVFLARDANGIFAMSGICQHQGCGVEFRATARTFECPCHGSLHAYDGAVLLGPTQRPLNHVQVTLQNGCLVVDPDRFVPASTRLVA